MAISKVVFGTSTLIDLTDDTITANDVINNKTFHVADGSTSTGNCTFDADTSDATATAPEILSTKTAYKNGNKLVGTMPNIGTTTLVISTTNEIAIPSGYHDGSGKAIIDSTELAKLIPDNIRESVSILGITGNMSGSEDVHATTATATPSKVSQTLTPPQGYNYFTQVTVNAISYVETDNAAGGKTVTIAGS